MNELPESLVRIVQALIQDPDLALWFESLEELSPPARATEFRQMAGRMRASGSDLELEQAVSLLAAPGVYGAVLSAFRELCESL